jgi:hypothetical protein
MFSTISPHCQLNKKNMLTRIFIPLAWNQTMLKRLVMQKIKMKKINFIKFTYTTLSLNDFSQQNINISWSN